MVTIQLFSQITGMLFIVAFLSACLEFAYQIYMGENMILDPWGRKLYFWVKEARRWKEPLNPITWRIWVKGGLAGMINRSSLKGRFITKCQYFWIKFLGKMAYPLGYCLFCNGFWLTALIYIGYFHDISFTLFLCIGLNALFLRIGVLFKINH